MDTESLRQLTTNEPSTALSITTKVPPACIHMGEALEWLSGSAKNLKLGSPYIVLHMKRSSTLFSAKLNRYRLKSREVRLPMASTNETVMVSGVWSMDTMDVSRGITGHDWFQAAGLFGPRPFANFVKISDRAGGVPASAGKEADTCPGPGRELDIQHTGSFMERLVQIVRALAGIQIYHQDYQHGQSAAYVCVTVLFRAWIIRKACGWRLAGWLKPQGTSRIWTPLH